MNITEANALNNLLRHFLNAPREITGEVSPEKARESARTLVEKSYKAISAGITPRDFDKLWPEGATGLAKAAERHLGPWEDSLPETPEALIKDGVLTCPKCGKQDIREVDICERWNPAELWPEGPTPYIAVSLNDPHFEHDGWICLDCQTRLTVPEPLDENVSYS